MVSNECLFIHGPSGSGKTTLLSLLVGILRPQQGHIRLLGQSLGQVGAGRRDHLRADHIGMIFQQFNLIPYLTPVENVLLTCQFSALRRQRALAKSSSVAEEAVRLLSHLDMADPRWLKLPVHQLSVGQQQRIAVARALMGSPELVVADEPTSSLDSERREQFIDLLFNECKASGAALLFVSHDAQLADLFDRQMTLQYQDSARVALTEQGPAL
nr:ATP-binding cassette domain-containing protein [Motiliproteus sediminis]